MVLIQLLLPTSGPAGAHRPAPLAETRRELAARFKGLTAYLDHRRKDGGPRLTATPSRTTSS